MIFPSGLSNVVSVDGFIELVSPWPFDISQRDGFGASGLSQNICAFDDFAPGDLQHRGQTVFHFRRRIDLCKQIRRFVSRAPHECRL